MIEIGASRFRLKKVFDWGRGGAEVGWFRREEIPWKMLRNPEKMREERAKDSLER